MSIALDALIFITGWTHVLLAPFTKVEESFNLHATHDVLMYGVGIENLYNYDHFTFPGAVARTLIGSVLLAWVSTPFIWLSSWLGLVKSKFELQIIVRLVLASLNAWTLCLIRRGVSRRFGRGCGLFFSLLTCSQFHLPFWMGRTIPNMFAMIPVNYSTYLLIDRQPNSKRPSRASLNLAVSLLTFTAVIFRAEVALLLVPLCLQHLVTKRVTFSDTIKVGFASSLFSIALTIVVDSYFWNQFLLWPEFSGIYFNIFQGKSAEWGTSPPQTYITSYLPKLLLSALPLSMIGCLSDKRIRSLLIPPLGLIAAISNLGHKEWRFIIYVIPIFNIAASRGAKWMVSHRKGAVTGRLCFLITCGLILCNIIYTTLSIKASIANYPGGFALHRLQQRRSDDSAPALHISNLAAQTGASLFLHLYSPPYHASQYALSPGSITTHPWRYNKTEDLSPGFLFGPSSPFSFLVSEVPPTDIRNLVSRWQTLETIHSFDRWAINWDVLGGSRKAELLKSVGRVLELKKSEKLWILEKMPVPNS